MTLFQGNFKIRRGSSAAWASADPTLADGELGYDTDVHRFKVGDGSIIWSQLGWLTQTPFTPPSSSGWTALNSGSVSNDRESRSITLASGAGDNWKGELRTANISTNYTATFYIDWAVPAVNFAAGGIILKNSGGAQIISFGVGYDSSLGGFNMRAIKWNSVTSFNATYLDRGMPSMTNGMPNWLRVRDDATTRFLEYSYNRIDWVTYHSIGRTDFITPNQIGWAASASNVGGTYTMIMRAWHLSGVS